ncbi:MAG: hypothetical protein IS860_09875 [Nitrosopumilus sp.]|nr:hypothetical protein [Nitrosopumilus sp.]
MSHDNEFVSTIDVPIEQEILYDYDDMHGVVDDKINPLKNEDYTPTVSTIEILGGKCVICPENHERLLTIHYIRDPEENNSEFIKRLVEKAISRGENPKKDFRLLCHNCNIRMKNMKKFMKHTGLPELSQDKLEHGLRMINN